MKKLIVALTVVCLLLAGVYSYLNFEKNKTAEEVAGQVEAAETVTDEQSAEVSDAETGTESEAAADDTTRTMDYEALADYLDDDEVVMTINGNEITWKDYHYWLNYWTETAEYYITMYSYYGMEASWEDYADAIKEYSKEQLVTLYAIEDLAAEYGVEPTEEQLQTIEEDLNTAVIEAYGEATEENINEYLESRGISYESYMRLAKADANYQGIFNAVYGENGELAEDEDVVAWLEENEYMYATHILLATTDLTTGEDLDEETIAEKLALAEDIVKQLGKIKSGEKRLAKFNELKAEYCEDTGKESYPDGYYFLTGEMVEEFEQGYQALENDYDYTEPVLTSYGYHIIMKLPYNLAATMEYSDEETALSPKASYANEQYGLMLDESCTNAEVVVYDCINNLSVLDYLK